MYSLTSNPADVLKSALDDISREGGWTHRAYEDNTGARCMLGAIAHVEYGYARYYQASRRSEAWRYVMKAAKRLYPLKWQLRVMFSSKHESVFPERMIIKVIGGRWKARRILKMALKMAEKDARIDAQHKATKEAEEIVRSAAETHSVEESDRREYASTLY